jgi:cytochrome c oxidase cbb3-type subunit 4
MDINDFRSATTVILMLLFIGVWIWAWSPKRKKSFDEAAQLPFADEQTSAAQSKKKEAIHD